MKLRAFLAVFALCCMVSASPARAQGKVEVLWPGQAAFRIATPGGNFTMDDADAAFATREYLKPRYAIPMHYGSHPLHTGTPQKFIQALGNAPVKVFPLNPGEKAEF